MIIAFARQGQEIGQFPEDEVAALVASGQILPSDDYWHEGLDDWRKVGDRWPVAEVAHYPTTPVMTMDDVPTSSRSGFALVFWLMAVLLIAGGAYWYFNLRPAPEEPAAVAQPSEEITEPTIAELVAPAEESADEQASVPAPTPEPVATEEELALEWLRENPKRMSSVRLSVKGSSRHCTRIALTRLKCFETHLRSPNRRRPRSPRLGHLPRHPARRMVS